MHEVVTDLAAESLQRAGRLRLRVTGTSMLPAIPPGSLVLIRRAGLDCVRPGDIVLVRAAHAFRLHRLVALAGSSVVTRGDNLDGNDPPESAARLLGVVAHIEKPRLLPRIAARLRKFLA